MDSSPLWASSTIDASCNPTKAIWPTRRKSSGATFGDLENLVQLNKPTRSFVLQTFLVDFYLGVGLGLGMGLGMVLGLGLRLGLALGLGEGWVLYVITQICSK